MLTLCYARVSRKEQSLETQLFLFQKEGFNELFVEKISGRGEDRPEFQKLCDRALALVSEGNQVEVLFVEFSRWGRNTSYTLQKVEQLERAGVRLRELNGGDISVATASDLLSTGMKALMAHYYSVELSERVSRAYERRRANRAPLCGNAPFGYRYSDDKTHLVIDEVQGPIARQIVDRMLAGESKYKVRRWLVEEYGLSKSGDGINKLVQCEAWRGNIVDIKNNRVVYGTHAALVTEAERQQLIKRIDLHRRLRGANQGKLYPIPTGGLIRCARCGYALLTSTTQARRYFRCVRIDCDGQGKYVRSESIEAAIQEAITESAAMITDAVAESDAVGGKSVDPRVAQLEAEIEQLKPLAHRPAVAMEIEYIQSELEQIKTSATTGVADVADRMKMVEDLGGLTSDQWAALSVLERRDIYEYLVEVVLLDRHEILEVKLRH